MTCFTGMRAATLIVICLASCITGNAICDAPLHSDDSVVNVNARVDDGASKSPLVEELSSQLFHSSTSLAPNLSTITLKVVDSRPFLFKSMLSDDTVFNIVIYVLIHNSPTFAGWVPYSQGFFLDEMASKSQKIKLKNCTETLKKSKIYKNLLDARPEPIAPIRLSRSCFSSGSASNAYR